MSTVVFVANQNLCTVTCYKCAVLFAMPVAWDTEFRKTHQEFYCPAGHRQYYSGESTEEKLRREVANLQTTIERKEAYEAELRSRNSKLTRRCSAVRGVVTRIKNRVGAGVCPCCNRTFQALANHMQSKHPEYRTSLHE